MDFSGSSSNNIIINNNTINHQQAAATSSSSSRYENQKRRDWKTFGQYLNNHRPPSPSRDAAELTSLNSSGTWINLGRRKCTRPSALSTGFRILPRRARALFDRRGGSLDALVGRLRAAFEENGGKPEANPFGARAVRLYLREVRDLQSKARGISYEKKRKRPPSQLPLPSHGAPS